MPTLLDVTSAAQAYGQAQYDNGKADQKAIDDTLYADLQAAFDAYKASHPDQHPPPPPPAKVSYGGNFGTSPDETRYVKPVLVARLFPGSGYPTDLTTSSAYREAKAAGAKTVVLDFPSTITTAQVTATVKSGVADGVTVIASGVHEPEHGNKMTPAAWVALQVKLAPVIRAAGGLVGPILQSATVAGLAGRNLADYTLPAGTADLAGFDLYPKTQIIVQSLLLPKIKSAAQSVFGTTRILIGEYGVPPAGSDSVALIHEFKTWFNTNGGEYACYWSQADTVLSDATAAAWFS